MNNAWTKIFLGALLILIAASVFIPNVQAQRQMPPEYKDIAAASRLTDADARLKEFERIKAAYPNSEMMKAINSFILTAKIELADTLEAVLGMQKGGVEQAQGPERLAYMAGSAEEILEHPKLNTFAPPLVTAAVQAYKDQAFKAASLPDTFKGIPPDQIKFFKDYYLSGFDVSLALAYLNEGQAAKALIALEAYKKNGGLPDGRYSYSLAEARAKLGQSKDALESYLDAAVDQYKDAADKAKALYIKLNGRDKGFEARLEAKVRELPYAVSPFKPSSEWKGKAVLAEIFTGSECPPCVGADLGFDGLIESYPARYLAVLEYHLPIPRPDPMMNPATKKRQGYYGVNSTPTVFIDGEKKMAGGGSRSMAGEKFKQYAAEVAPRLIGAPGVALTVEAGRAGDEVKVKCGFDRAVPGAEYYVVLVQGEEKYTGSNGIVFHKHVVRDLAVLDPASAREVVFNLAASEQAADQYLTDFEKTYDRIPNFKFAERRFKINRQGLKVVFFVQETTTKKVLNAAAAEVK